MPRPGPDSDKYARGVLGLVAGSQAYPGAGVLAAEAAVHAGAGMVRALGSAAEAVVAARPEVVPAEGRVQAWVVGPGMEPDTDTATAVRWALDDDVPVVLDAGALAVVAADEGLRAAIRQRAATTVLTPHDGEYARLAGVAPAGAARRRPLAGRRPRRRGAAQGFRDHRRRARGPELGEPHRHALAGDRRFRRRPGRAARGAAGRRGARCAPRWPRTCTGWPAGSPRPEARRPPSGSPARCLRRSARSPRRSRDRRCPRAVARVDLDAVRANTGRLREAASGRPLMAVVKADGYGHGLVPCARAALAGGATWLGVANLDEAVALREAGIEAPILAWIAVPGDADLGRGRAAAASTSRRARSGPLTRRWRRRARRGARPACTSRSTPGSAAPARRSPTGPTWCGTRSPPRPPARSRWSACGRTWPTPTSPATPTVTAQIARVREAAEAAAALGVRDPIRHLANSAATLAAPEAHFDLVRPGIAVYGLSPGPLVGTPESLGLRPAMTLEARLDVGQAGARRARGLVRATRTRPRARPPSGSCRSATPTASAGRRQRRAGARGGRARRDRRAGLHGPVRARPRRRPGRGRRRRGAVRPGRRRRADRRGLGAGHAAPSATRSSPGSGRACRGSTSGGSRERGPRRAGRAGRGLRRRGRWRRAVFAERRLRRASGGGRAAPDGEPLGLFRGRPHAVTADDGVELWAEIDDPRPGAEFADLTVVFSHGYALNLDSFHFQRQGLGGSARLVFWDQRGHGRSGRSPAEQLHHRAARPRPRGGHRPGRTHGAARARRPLDGRHDDDVAGRGAPRAARSRGRRVLPVDLGRRPARGAARGAPPDGRPAASRTGRRRLAALDAGPVVRRPPAAERQRSRPADHPAVLVRLAGAGLRRRLHCRRSCGHADRDGRGVHARVRRARPADRARGLRRVRGAGDRRRPRPAHAAGAQRGHRPAAAARRARGGPRSPGTCCCMEHPDAVNEAHPRPAGAGAATAAREAGPGGRDT